MNGKSRNTEGRSGSVPDRAREETADGTRPDAQDSAARQPHQPLDHLAAGLAAVGQVGGLRMAPETSPCRYTTGVAAMGHLKKLRTRTNQWRVCAHRRPAGPPTGCDSTSGLMDLVTGPAYAVG